LNDFNNLLKMLEVPESTNIQSKDIEIGNTPDKIFEVDFPNQILPDKIKEYKNRK